MWRRKWYIFTTLSVLASLVLSAPLAFMVSFQNDILEEPGHSSPEPYGLSEVYISGMFISGRIVQQLYVRAILWVGYLRQSKTNLQIMRLTSIYLILMVLIFPTISFAVGKVLLMKEYDIKEVLNCVFNARGTLTFVKLLISTSLLGNAAELLRVQDLFFLLYRLFKADSWAEIAAWLKFEKTLLWFGDYYSYDILNLTIAVSMSTISPIILPIGLLYFTIKHLVCSFTLRTSFVPTKIDVCFHKASVSFVVASAVLSQIFTAVCINLKVRNKNLKEGNVEGREVCFASAFLSICSILLFALEVDSGWRWPIPVFPARPKKFKKDYSECDNHYYTHCMIIRTARHEKVDHDKHTHDVRDVIRE